MGLLVQHPLILIWQVFPMAVATADSIDTNAEVTLDQVDGGFAITAVKLILKAKIPGASQAQFEELSNKAKEGCPVSKVLNARISLDATLVS